MKRSLTTLNLPKYKLQFMHRKGYRYVEDINIDTLKSEFDINPETWSTLLSSGKPKSAYELSQNTHECISTSCNEMDDMLGGGIHLTHITQLYGLPGSGKTQLCLQLCVNVQMPQYLGGLMGNAIYIDSKYGFSKQRFTELIKGKLKSFQQNRKTIRPEHLKLYSIDSMLSNVHYLQVTNTLELFASLNMLKKFLITQSIKLVVIDNFTHPFRNCDKQNYEKVKLIYTFLSELQQLATKYVFAIVVTNDMTTKFHAEDDSYEAPALGETFAHRANTIIHVKHVVGEIFNAFLSKSVGCPPNNAHFKVTPDGICGTD